MLAIWAGEPPYNLRGKYWNVVSERHFLPQIGQGFLPKPLQRPHPPIVVTAVAPFSKGVTEAAARGWEPISANFLMPVWVKSSLAEIRRRLRARRAVRPIRPIGASPKASSFADDDRTARALCDRADSPYRFYYSQLFTKLKANGRIELFKTHRDQPDDEVTHHPHPRHDVHRSTGRSGSTRAT